MPTEDRVLLIVDDDLLTRRTLARTLHDPAYRILQAGSSEEALEFAKHQLIQVVLCDQNMVGGNGVDLLTTLTRLYPSVVRLMLTSDTSRELLVDAVNDGQVRRLLYKPWDDVQLRAVVRNAFNLPKRVAKPRVHVLLEPRPSSFEQLSAMFGLGTDKQK